MARFVQFVFILNERTETETTAVCKSSPTPDEVLHDVYMNFFIDHGNQQFYQHLVTSQMMKRRCVQVLSKFKDNTLKQSNILMVIRGEECFLYKFKGFYY